MALTTGERSLHKTQVGLETTHGTAVAATAMLNGLSSGIGDLDRAPANPNEDYGVLAMNQPSRGYYGVRRATMPWRGDVRFEDLMYPLAAGTAGGVTPTLVATGVYLWTYTADNASDSLSSFTIEEGDNIQAWKMPYSLVESLKLSFGSLSAPGNTPWQQDVTWIGQDKVAVTFAAVSSLASAETAMGHLTTIAVGSTATAFAALAALQGIVSCEVDLPSGVTTRKWGDSALDTFSFHGRGKIAPQLKWRMYQSAATTSPLMTTGFLAAGSPMGESRVQIKTTGSIINTTYAKTLTINARIRWQAVKVAEDADATIYDVTGDCVYDSTLGGIYQVLVQNAVATLP